MNISKQSRALAVPIVQGNLLPSETGGSQADGSVLSLVLELRLGRFGIIRWDNLLHREVIETPAGCLFLEKAEITKLLINLQIAGFGKIKRSDLTDAIHLVAKENAYDSAVHWLDQLPPWDRVPRVERFLPDYLGTLFRPYEIAVSRFIWTGMVARILLPDCKLDMLPILVGDEGVRKTDLLKLMAPTPGHFTDVCLTDRASHLAQKVQGITLAVWEEMRGIRGSTDAHEVKAFISGTGNEIYSRNRVGMDRFPRRFILFGTSSSPEILQGNSKRRYLPFHIPSVIDLKKFQTVRDQLWAEAIHMTRERLACGKTPVDFEDAERLAKNVHQSFAKEARWLGDDRLLRWLSSRVTRFSTEDALQGIGFSSVDLGRKEKIQMSETLRQLGYEKKSTRQAGSANSYQRWDKI